MKMVFAYVLGTLILLPIIAFFIAYLIFRKFLKKKANYSFRLAADVTTFFLFFSVAISISTLWGTAISIVVITISFLIAIIMTFIDWRTRKEIEVIPLLRRIWRVQFVYLFLVYNIVWIVGIVQNILLFVT